MGEYANDALRMEIRRGFKVNPNKEVTPNPLTAKCPICGKWCRSLNGDLNGGLKEHMKAKHIKAYRENPPKTRYEDRPKISLYGREVPDWY